METSARNKRRQIILWMVIGLVGLCLVGAGLSFLSNQTLPDQIDSNDRLPDLDKARLAETLHLKQELGDQVWPGLAVAEIPILLWNDEDSFLVNYDGETAVPAGWQMVTVDTFQGQSYYRRATADSQNFAVQVGDQWAASMGTKLQADLFVREMIQGLLPPPINQIVPYSLLIQPSEVQLTGVLHEAFHVFQRDMARAHFDDAELAYRHGAAYWAADVEMNQAWEQEIDLLVQALDASSDEQVAGLVAQFLVHRRERRQAHGLDPDLVAFERRFEWLEGLAKYVELEIWRQAAETDDYRPFPVMAEDPDFDAYAGFDGRWSQEIGQMKRQADQEGDTRFYYTGMAQAVLLDRLAPDWKEQVMEDGVWLEDLLESAVE